MHAYSTWGAYGASKAALNHLAMTMKSEEPDITTIAIRPGVVDTEMQRELREVHHDRLDKKDQEKFMDAKANGTCEYHYLHLMTPAKTLGGGL